MTAKEIYRYLLEGANEIWEITCDGLISGDENKTVNKIGTCFKLTAEVLMKGIKEGVDMIIMHEPAFSNGDLREQAAEIDRKKWELLDQSGIVLYRFHDQAHDTEPDYIHAGFIQSLDLKIRHKFPREQLGICRYVLDEPLTTRELGLRIKEKLGVKLVKIVGKDDYPIETICLGLGSVGFPQINYLRDPGCDVFVTGEVGEVGICEYIRDACFFGENKSILILGHYSSEFAGMRLLAEKLNSDLVPAVYLDCGEVFHSI